MEEKRKNFFIKNEQRINSCHTSRHHTSISDSEERERERIGDQTETFVQSKHTKKCLCALVPLALSIDDRSIVCINREKSMEEDD